MAPVGLILIVVSIARRKSAIGGWLLYFLGQLLLGGVTNALAVLSNLDQYRPSSWGDSLHYLIFLLSVVPSLLILLCLIVSAIALVRTENWAWVERMKLLLAADIVAGLLSLGIDSMFFPDNLMHSMLGLLFPSIFLPYLFLSTRVRRVFLTKDWDAPLAAPSLLNIQGEE